MSKVHFRPVQGLEEKIKNFPQNEGCFYVATDTGRIYLDTETENKLPIGSSGVQVIYGTDNNIEIEYDGNENPTAYLILLSELSTTNCHVNDLILNSDGCFYRILNFALNGNREESARCEKLTMAGSGGEEAEHKVLGTVSLSLDSPTDVLNGATVKAKILVKCRTVNGVPQSDNIQGILTVSEIKSSTEKEIYYTSPVGTYEHNVEQEIDLTDILRNSATSEVYFSIYYNPDEENNRFSKNYGVATISTHQLNFSWKESGFSNTNPITDEKINVQWLMSDDISRAVEVYFDDYLVLDKSYTSRDTSSEDSFTITPTTEILGGNKVAILKDYFTHGEHIIKAKLYLTNNSVKGAGTDFIQKEIVIRDMKNKTPLIWTQDFKTEYYTYETIRIPFKVLDPNNNGAFVSLYKNGVQVGTRSLNSNQIKEWQYWEITDLTVDDSSYYTIKVGTEPYSYSRNFTFTILVDPLRDMKLARKNNLLVNFVATGRSNSEGKLGRQTLEIINGKYAEFKNFNWYNNGWVFDENNTTCLRVSNGAEVSIPIGTMEFDNGSANSTHTIEIQFKIRNPQNYAKVITKYTRYKFPNGDTDDAAWAEFKAQKDYLNYDEFLSKKYFKNHPEHNYDELEYSKIEQDFNMNNLVCAYGKLGDTVSPGIYFSPQDATFTSNGKDETVSVDFIENEMLNLSFVYTKNKDGITGGNSKLLEIFMNGVLTSVKRRTEDQAWTIDSDTIKFMSNTCDIDIYSIRIYNTDLTIPEVVQNYAFDKKDIKQWDQKDLYENNTNLQDDIFSFTKMKRYNENHPTEPLMPYIVLRTTYNNSDNTQNRLPYSKDKDAQAGTMEFVNAPLEAAYNSGELAKVAEKAGQTVEEYYIHHCPSFITTLNGCTFQVQGTSSRNYPRRNYKAKCKESMLLNRGPYAKAYEEAKSQTFEDITKHPCYLEYFYMDNKTVGTTKFTLKIDYMESSGDYNRGFANLVNEIYSKHPVEDYQESFDKYDLYGNLDDYRTSVKGFPVLAFHYMSEEDNNYITENSNNCIYIGKYNMLLDKGSDECFGFKPSKEVLQNQIKGTPKVRDIAECWEFQNNSRTYCSFRDPWNRYKLSFRAPDMTIDLQNPTNSYLTLGAPKVVDSFEPRYNSNDDLIAKKLFKLVEITDPDGKETETISDDLTNVAPDRLIPETIVDEATQKKHITWTIKNPDSQEVKFNVNDNASKQELLLALMSNWEDAVSWVWSTCLDCDIEFEDGEKLEIPSMGTYTKIDDLAEALYKSNTYYIEKGTNDSGSSIYELATGDYDFDASYYKLTTINDTPKYVSIKLTNDPNKVYKVNTYYILTDSKNEIYTLSTNGFDAYLDYYSFVRNEDRINSRWALPSPVVYDSITYTKDSKEYRQAKFKNELSNFFDIEYLASYFLMTEIFECYDSRGKNAMFASWGPQKDNIQKSTGKQHYVWYPIFYDIDTQLGINNTGIPSFEYYIDATEEGSFSTNDSVLWNNFYSFFKDKMIDKYKQLMGVSNNSYNPNNTRVNKIFTKGSSTTSKKSDIVDKWYCTDPSVFPNSYAVLGDRPIIALNLDEEYKYIIPTNSAAKNTVFGRLINSGQYEVENDQYFYALQGNRNLYRAQFLANRLNYIDSWLTVDEYASGSGGSFIRSRISANNPKNTSDKWVEGPSNGSLEGLIVNSQYWKNNEEFEEKNHEFDGQYWIDMEPARNSYVTVGTDGANFPSQKYNGLVSVKFTAPDLKKGIMSSPNYREQLYYIYGMDQMKSLGDLSKLYFQEFAMEGKASRLTDLLLGYDGLSEEDGKPYTYFNKDVNDWSFPSSGMPLLKEMNLCNITFKGGYRSFDLSKSEKLENFRNTGSNVSKVEFAQGVALNTLYLTKETNYLSLVEANLLTKLITKYVNPTKSSITKKLEVLNENRGLYIQGLTDVEDSKAETAITTFDIRGGNLGYYSYELLRKYIQASKNSSLNLKDCAINLTDVQWSPYRLLTDTNTKFDINNISYFKDNGHFQLEAIPASEVSKITKSEIKNNQIYYLDTIHGYEDIHNKITDYSLLIEIYNSYKGLNSEKPQISGVIYIENDSAFDESVIQNELQKIYPDLTIFMKNVNKEYSVKFIVEVQDADNELIQEVLKIQKLPKNTSKVFFDSPVDEDSDNYISFGTLQEKRPTYDFKGWKDDSGTSIIVVDQKKDSTGNVQNIITTNNWNTLKLSSDKLDYTFIGTYKQKSYTIKFVNGDGITAIEGVYPYGDKITVPKEFYYYKDDGVASGLDLYETWNQTGWSDADGVKIDLNKQLAYADRTFYATGEKVNVYNKVLTNDDTHIYYNIIEDNGATCIEFTELANKLGGKITIPASYNGKAITRIKNIIASEGKTVINNTKITGIFVGPKEENKISIIDQCSFFGTTNLEYFDFSNCLTQIGMQAFQNSNLSQVNIIPRSSSTTGLKIQQTAFSDTKIGQNSSQHIFIIQGCKDGVVEIGNRAFNNIPVVNNTSPYATIGPLIFQFGTNQYPIGQLSLGNNAFKPLGGWGPSNNNKLEGIIRCYYLSTFESITATAINSLVNTLNANFKYTSELIVK